MHDVYHTGNYLGLYQYGASRIHRGHRLPCSFTLIGNHTMLRYKAPGDRVIIKRDKQETQTEGGIVLPTRLSENILKGVVYAAGPDAHGVMVDDIVIFQTKYATLLDKEEGIYSADLPSLLALSREEE